MARAARPAVGVDEGRLTTPQRALVLLTFLLVIAALALFARQAFGGDGSKGKRRVLAAPHTSSPVTAPTTTAPATTVPPTDSSPGPAGGTAGEGPPPEEPQPTEEAQPADGPQPAETSPPPGEEAAPPVPADAPPAEASVPETPAAEAPAPAAWYVTFNGGNPEDASNVNDVLAYDAAGAPIPTPVLAPGATGLPLDLRELRGMAFGTDGMLFVVNSYQADSKVLAFAPAGPDGTRPFLGELAHGYPLDTLNPGVRHPYGLALDGAGNVLVSSQDSQVVTRLSGPAVALPEIPGTPTATATSLCPNEPCQYYPGTFAPGTHAPGDPLPSPPPVSSKEGGLKSPRAVVYVSGNNTVYAADNADSSVKAYDATTGSFTGPGKGRVITGADGLSEPVGMAVYNGILYVADEGTDTVLGLDLITPGAKAEVVVPTSVGDVTLARPSGLAFDKDGVLYVASREGRQVTRYELSGDGMKVKKAKVFLDDLPDQPEQIVAVPG